MFHEEGYGDVPLWHEYLCRLEYLFCYFRGGSRHPLRCCIPQSLLKGGGGCFGKGVYRKNQMERPCRRKSGSTYGNVKSSRFWKNSAGMTGQSSFNCVAVAPQAFWRIKRSLLRLVFASLCQTGCRSSGFKTLPKRTRTSRFASQCFSTAVPVAFLIYTRRAPSRLGDACSVELDVSLHNKLTEVLSLSKSAVLVLLARSSSEERCAKRGWGVG